MELLELLLKIPAVRKFIILTLILVIGLPLLFGLIWLILAAYTVAWTGFGDYQLPNSDYMRGKTLWDWMELLIIPLFLAGGAFYFNRSEREADRLRAEERARLEREIATDRQQEVALQAYLDRISDLLLREKLRVSENEELRNVARIRTLTVLRGLDTNRKGMVIRFLSESGLITGEPIINLSGADLNGVSLNEADLHGAILNGAILKRASLRWANLSGADLRLAHLEEADLEKADLSGANLNVAFLEGADLSDADLSQASLRMASVYSEQLANVKSIKGAIMPGGNIHD